MIAASAYTVASSSADGTYDLMVPAGTFDVIASADGYVPATAGGVVVTGG